MTLSMKRCSIRGVGGEGPPRGEGVVEGPVVAAGARHLVDGHVGQRRSHVIGGDVGIVRLATHRAQHRAESGRQRHVDRVWRRIHRQVGHPDDVVVAGRRRGAERRLTTYRCLTASPSPAIEAMARVIGIFDPFPDPDVGNAGGQVPGRL